MRNKIALIFLIFFIIMNIEYTFAKTDFIFDNANVINNPEKLNTELDYLANKYGAVILIETTYEQVTDVDYDTKFHAYGLDDIGNLEFNLLIYYNIETGEGKIIHHTRARLTDDIIEQTFFTDETEKYFREKDYENMFIEMITSLEKFLDENAPVKINFMTDPIFYEQLKRNGINQLNLYYDTNTVADFEDLVCTFNIKTEGFFEWLVSLIFKNEIIYSITSNNQQIQSGTIECNNECSIKIPSRLTKRGEKISCAVQFDDNTYSSSVDVSEFNYVFVKIDNGIIDIEEQFDTFLDLSAVEEENVKKIYIENCPSITLSDFTETSIDRAKNFCLENENTQRIELDTCLFDRIINLYGAPKFQDKIYECLDEFKGNLNPEFDRIIAHSSVKEIGSRAYRDNLLISITDNGNTLAHEIGHTYNLCDEYNHFQYGFLSLERGCLNPYPWCAVDSPENTNIVKDESGAISCFKNDGKCYYTTNIERPNIPTGYSLLFRRPPKCPEKDGFESVCIVTSKRMRELNNNCYPPNIDAEIDSAGMPLPDKTKLNSPFRSIMGSSDYRKYDLVKYPPEAPYPLNPK